MTIPEIKSRLTSLVSKEEGTTLRAELEALALASYVPRHTPEQIVAFLVEHGDSTCYDRMHPCHSQPNVWSMVNKRLGFIYADSVRELFDLAIERVKPDRPTVSQVNT